MQIIHQVFKTKSICKRHVCLYSLFIFALVSLLPRAYTQTSKPGIDADDERLNVLNRTRSGMAGNAGEFYRVEGRKIRLLTSLEKVAVYHKLDQGPAIRKRLRARQRTGRLFTVEHELAKEQMLIVRTSGVSSLTELDEVVRQIKRESDVDQVTPVFINEETGLEMILTNEFIVKLSPEATPEQLEALNRRMGITLVRRLRGTTDQFMLSMDSFSPEGLLDMCEVYLNEPIIAWASPNFLSQIVFDSASDDFNYHPNQWHLEKIDAAGAWDITTGSKDIVVAVIDNGVDIDHKDLRDNFPEYGVDRSDNGYPNDYFGWDFYDDDNNPRPSDPNDNHGTGVAGVIAAKGNNDEGVLGCAYNCTLMAVKITKGGDWAPDTRKAEAILYAAGFHEDGKGRWRGADVINMSFHFSYAKAEINEAIHKAATEGRGGKGCPIFCSSGNEPAGWKYDGAANIPSGINFTFRWEYLKDSSGSSDHGAVWLDRVVFHEGDEERFEYEGNELPSGWETGGDSSWIQVQNGVDGDHAMTGWDGQSSKAMRTGSVGLSWLEVTRSVDDGDIEFWYWPFMESGDKFDFVIKLGNEELHREPFSPEKKTQDLIPIVAYPASHPDTIAVGASTNFDYRADYSRYGFGLDFVAPSSGGSEYVYTTDRTDTNTESKGYTVGDYYTRFGMTSAAAPLAAGVGALMLSANSDLTAQQVRYIMQNTCEKIGYIPYDEEFDNNPNTNRYYGYGRINASLAVNTAYDSIGYPAAPTGLEFVNIPGGIFEMGDHYGDGRTNELPIHTVTLDEFTMSKYEITNAQYSEYLNASMAHGLIQIVNGVVYASSDTDKSEPYYETSGAEFHSQIEYNQGQFSVLSRTTEFDDIISMRNHPVTEVSWYGAKAFCDYYGYHLPTEAEWEYAARGGYHNPYYKYPWGSNNIDSRKCNYYSNNPLLLTNGPTTTFRGYFGEQGEYGLCDMSGNVWEWCQDWYSFEYYISSPTNNPIGPSEGIERVLRGGAFHSGDSSCRVSNRVKANPTDCSYNIGFRVCR